MRFESIHFLKHCFWFVKSLLVWRLNLTDMRWNANAITRKKIEHPRHFFNSIVVGLINKLFIVSIESHGAFGYIIFCCWNAFVKLNPTINTHNSSFCAKWNKGKSMDVCRGWHRFESRSIAKNLLNVPCNLSDILIHGHDAFGFIRWSQANVTNAENVLVNFWRSRWMVLCNWMLIANLQEFVHPDLTSFWINAFGKLISQEGSWSIEFESSTINVASILCGNPTVWWERCIAMIVDSKFL